MLTQEYLKEILDYDPNTGEFRWKYAGTGKNANGIAGCLTKNKYIFICVNGKLYRAHRLAWLYVYGYVPVNQIDHINGDPSDNRICNLREATNAENAQNMKKKKNNTSGYVGVSWSKHHQKWGAYVFINRKKIHVGFFDCPHEANRAREDAKARLHSFNPVQR